MCCSFHSSLPMLARLWLRRRWICSNSPGIRVWPGFHSMGWIMAANALPPVRIIIKMAAQWILLLKPTCRLEWTLQISGWRRRRRGLFMKYPVATSRSIMAMAGLRNTGILPTFKSVWEARSAETNDWVFSIIMRPSRYARAMNFPARTYIL